jgi:excisionase family DNA binding protein
MTELFRLLSRRAGLLREVADLDLELARVLDARPKGRNVKLSAEAADAALLDVQDVAARLRLKPAAVRALARRGEITFERVGRGLRFRPGDVESYLERQRRPARGERAAACGGVRAANKASLDTAQVRRS